MAKKGGAPTKSEIVAQITKDTDRDFFMTAEQAKEYRIVDEVISSKPTPRPVPDSAVAAR